MSKQDASDNGGNSYDPFLERRQMASSLKGQITPALNQIIRLWAGWLTFHAKLLESLIGHFWGFKTSMLKLHFLSTNFWKWSLSKSKITCFMFNKTTYKFIRGQAKESNPRLPRGLTCVVAEAIQSVLFAFSTQLEYTLVREWAWFHKLVNIKSL